MIKYSSSMAEGQIYDVVVAGGGTAGWVAALAAARQNKRVIILERKGSIGGVMGTGLPLLGFHDDNYKQVVKGYAHELVEKLVEAGASNGYQTTDLWHNSFVTYNSAAMRPIITQMLYDAGVKVVFFSHVTDVVMEGKRLKGILVQGKTGSTLYLGKIFIDATGDAGVAYYAGAQMQEISEFQPPSMVVRIENVDIDRLRKHMYENPSDYPSYRLKPGKALTKEFLETTPFFFALPERIGNVKYEGEYLPLIDRFMFTTMENTRGVIVNMLRARDIICSDSESLSDATMICYMNAINLVNGFRENVPGFENAYLCDSDPEMQVRETRRIVGEYTMQEEDVVAGKDFEDSIAVGSYFIDIHSSRDSHGTWKRTDKAYGIPYRALIPKEIEGLLAAGRCISGSRGASASYRVMATCMAMGQAAGTAASISIDNGILPRNIDASLLRNKLVQEGAIVAL